MPIPPALPHPANGHIDHFSTQATAYVQFRPHYPAPLFTWLASVTPDQALAWDCACGNGQASVDLARHFARVVATDVSAAQIAAAPVADGVGYRVAPADASGLETASVSLVTVAQALHWFDLARFYAEARRVLKPGGVIACWSYGRCALDDPALNTEFQRFYDQVTGPYWPAERAHVETGYRDLAFPWHPVPAPPFALEVRWSVAELLGYIRSWSASVRYQQATGGDAATVLADRWGKVDPAHPLAVRWPLSILAGRR